MPRPRNAFIVPSRPFQVQPELGGLIPITTVSEPVIEVCFVPVNGNQAEAEALAGLIVYWSEQDAKGLIS